MTIKEEILYTALLKACEFIRQNPISDLDAYFKLGTDAVSALCGGAYRDPKGKEFASIFINKAVEEIEKTNRSEQ